MSSVLQKLQNHFCHSLVEHRCVGVPVLFDDGDNEHDEFGPEVQVLDARTLLLQGQLLLVLN